MTTRRLQIALVFGGDSEVRRLVTRENNRFAAVFAAFAARGIEAHPAVYNRAQLDELREQLLQVDGALVWVNPIEACHSRAPLDVLLREVAAAGVFVSTHPDVILKLGTKDVLVDTREMGWGSDAHRLDTLRQLRGEVGGRLAGGATRVLKQWRGHSGMGIWRVQRAPSQIAFNSESRVLARHAPRGNAEVEISFDEFVGLMAPYFEDGGHMVDQAWQPRLSEGMVRCYLVQDRVAGFGLQAVNALHPPLAGNDSTEPPQPSQRTYHHRISRPGKVSSGAWRRSGCRSCSARSASGRISCLCYGTVISCSVGEARARAKSATCSVRSTSAALRRFPILRSSRWSKRPWLVLSELAQGRRHSLTCSSSPGAPQRHLQLLKKPEQVILWPISNGRCRRRLEALQRPLFHL